MERNEKITYLKDKAKIIRETLLTMVYKAQSGHPGGSLSSADMVAALYFDEMNIDAKKPNWEDRDRFVLSKGHVCPVVYSTLALKGYYDYEDIYTLREYTSHLQGHPDMKKTPGIDMSTGSLGQGLSPAVGMAIAGKRDNKDYRVFVLLGDGEIQEGQIWEATQSAHKYKLDNLIIIVDFNNLQIDGTCDEVMPNLDIAKKFNAFGCETYEIDGDNMEQILDTLETIREAKNGMPKCIVMKTLKGRGVSFMEDVGDWHGIAPNDEQYEQAIKEIKEGLK